jgi:hypothetical protein
MIFGTIWMGLYMATGGSMNDLILGDDLPNWFWFEVFLSPQDGYPVAAMLAFGQTKFLGLEFDLPSWINLYSLAFAQLLGTIIPLMLAYWWFEKRDV